MHDTHLLRSLAMVLAVAAVTTVLFQKLRQPVILGYLIAGLVIGPHLPIPLVADLAIVQTLSELGVILLMFSLGLEFSFSKLMHVGATAAITAIVELSLMLWLAFVTARALGFTPTESLFAGAMFAISSTTIIAKVFEAEGIRGRLRDVVFGVLIVEDLVTVLIMASLTTAASKDGVTAGALASTTARLAAFLVGIVAVGLLVVPRAVRAVMRLGRPETTLVASVGLCFSMAILAQEFGYSVALGAFLAGALVAESGEEHAIARLVAPVRDMFVAVFFVSVGMLLDPKLALEYWPAIAVFTCVVILGKVVSVSFGAFLTGNGARTSVQAGMSLAQIGEFSFIIAGLGISLGATRDFLFPVAISVSAITTLTTPWLIRASGPVANWIDRKSPRAVQTFATLYGSWLESLRRGSARKTTRAVVRRLVGLLAADALLLAAIVGAASAWGGAAADHLVSHARFSDAVAYPVVLAVAALLCIPCAVGAVRVARKLGASLAEIAFPGAAGSQMDRAAAPRRALVVTVQLAAVVLVALPVVAIAQPLLDNWTAAVVLGLLLILLGFVFWRTAADLHGHVRAGAQVIVEALASHKRSPGSVPADSLDPVHALLPGLGEPVPVRLSPGSPAVGRTLADLNLRGRTGATVLAIIRRDENSVVVPTARETLRDGDVLALAGTHVAVAAAREALLGAPT